MTSDHLRLLAAGVLDALLNAAELMDQERNHTARQRLNQAIDLALALTATVGLHRD